MNIERLLLLADAKEKLESLLPWQLRYFHERLKEAEAIALSSVSKCRSCGAPVIWGQTDSGKNCPFDRETGESHFRTCPEASKWSKKRSPLSHNFTPSQSAKDYYCPDCHAWKSKNDCYEFACNDYQERKCKVCGHEVYDRLDPRCPELSIGL